MPRGHHYSVDLKEKIIEAYKAGHPQSTIKNNFGVTKQVVSRIIKNFRLRGRVVNLKRGGRKRKTTKQLDRRIKRISQQNPRLSANQILAELDESNVSSRTIQRRLVEVGLPARRPAKKPLLSKKNIDARMLFATRHVHWTVKEWQNVLFSDECKFNIFGSDGLRVIRRPVNKRLDPKYVSGTVKHGGGNIMVWGCFSAYGIGPIHRIEGTMDRFMYRNILQDVMLPYAEWEMPLKFTYQHDNDPKHTAKIVKQWFRENNMSVLTWPGQSPDLNPIENLWEIVKTKVRQKNITNRDQLFQEIQSVWNSIDDDVISKLIASMPKRCQQVIDNKGYWTKY